jgi:regulatory protein
MMHPRSSIRNLQSSLTPLDYAYRLLARRAQSEQELADKMLAKGFTEAVVARTVRRLKEQGYLDDMRLAADQAERLRGRGFGPEGIRAKLIEKGLLPDTIAHALEMDKEEDETAAIRQFLASRFSVDALKQSQIRARAFRLLLRRGYSQEGVESVIGDERDSPWTTEKE